MDFNDFGCSEAEKFLIVRLNLFESISFLIALGEAESKEDALRLSPIISMFRVLVLCGEGPKTISGKVFELSPNKLYDCL